MKARTSNRLWLACAVLLGVLVLNGPATPQETRERGLETVQGNALSLAFSQDGSRLVTGGMDRTIRLWDAKGSLLATLPRQKWIIRGVAFSPNGQMVASIDDGKQICLWDVATQKLLTTLHETNDSFLSIAFSSDGKLLASGSANTHGISRHTEKLEWSGEVKLWNVQTGELKRTLNVHSGEVMGVSFAPDGQLVASAGPAVHLWNAQSGQLVKVFKPERGTVYALAFAPDGKTLVGAGAYGWTDPATGKISPRGHIKVWDIETGALVRTIEEHTGGFRCVAISPDGRIIASGSRGPARPFPGGRTKAISELRLWDLPTGKLRSTVEGGEQDGSEIRSLAFSPTPKILAVADEQTVSLLDPDAPELKQVLLKTELRPFSQN